MEIKCWGFNGPHLFRNSTHNPNRKMSLVNMLQEDSMVNDIAINVTRINVSLEDRQSDHQSTMLEVEGKILNTHVFILIDSRAGLSYIAPTTVEKCNLLKEKQKNAWLVQL